MGCGASSSAGKGYEVTGLTGGDGASPLASLEGLAARLDDDGRDLAAGGLSSSEAGSPAPPSPAKPVTQWDQLSPLLPLRSLRQIGEAGPVLGRKPWEQSVPGAVLIARLRGFEQLCADVLAPHPLDAASAASQAHQLSQVVEELFHRLVETVRALEGDVVHFTGDTLICAFSAEAPGRGGGGGGGGAGKEDELRGEADSQCVAACKCSLQLRQKVGTWAARQGGVGAERLSLSCAVGVGETAWIHLNAPPSRTSSDHFRSVVLRGSALSEANKAMAVALSLLAAPGPPGRGNDGVSVINEDVWEIACDTFATESLQPAAAAAPDPHPWSSSHRLLLSELPTGVAVGATEHAESGGLLPPSAVAAGLADVSSSGSASDESHKGLLPYLTIARQRSGFPAELCALIVMGFKIEMVASATGARQTMSTAQLNKVFGVVAERVNSANGVLQHGVIGHLPHEEGDVEAAAKGGVDVSGSGGGSAPPTHWCGLAVFGLTAVELDLQRSARCALALAQALETLPLLTPKQQAGAAGEGGGPVLRGSISLESGRLWLGRLGHRLRYQLCVLGPATSSAAAEAERHSVSTTQTGSWARATSSTAESDDDTPRGEDDLPTGLSGGPGASDSIHSFVLFISYRGILG